jgi:hypothetical protein
MDYGVPVFGAGIRSFQGRRVFVGKNIIYSQEAAFKSVFIRLW